MMQLKNIRVEKANRLILDAIHLQLNPGEVTVVIGVNGAGKSTLVRLLSGEWTPDAGEILWKGKALSGADPLQVARSRAVVNQQADLRFDFTVREVVEMGRFPLRQVSEKKIQEQVDAALSEVGLSDKSEARVTRISGGEQKRMLLARAMVQLTEARAEGQGVLLLDEPTAHLDLRHQETLLQSMRDRAAEGLAVFAVLHDLNHAARVADQLVIVHQGQILRSGAVEDVMCPELLSRIYGIRLERMAPPGHGPHWIARTARLQHHFFKPQSLQNHELIYTT
ncbi:heme ABC transporter ATP-binding protein [Kiritimatiellaeota bacterium B1221]|nr:heme ABC transporter ATP-binding protein [Kiritimatiellaeota bacterium B1221]